MGGAILDLVAKGGQDIYLISNPQLSFFKKVYKRHTNFSLEFYKFNMEGDVDFGKTTRTIIPRKGDLVKNMYLHFELPDLVPSGKSVSYVNYIGYSLIEYVEIYIGGTLIDRHTGDWLYVWNEINTLEGKKRAYYDMVGGKDITGYSSYDGNQGGVYIVPLSFWFGKDIGQAIPYVALQYSDIELKIKFREFDKLWISSNSKAPTGEYKIKNCEISVEYVFLDAKERKSFAQSNHEYLMKQIQYSTNNNIIPNQKKKKVNLNFNHPIVELIFFVQNKSVKDIGFDKGNDWFNYSKSISYPFSDPIKNAKIILNGEDRTPEMTAKELRLYTLLETHTSIPNNYIYVYSFSLYPEDIQPSGSCNFSRFDSKQLEIELADNIEHSELKVFALNYNVLRISKGLGGLAYIN